MLFIASVKDSNSARDTIHDNSHMYICISSRKVVCFQEKNDYYLSQKVSTIPGINRNFNRLKHTILEKCLLFMLTCSYAVRYYISK